MDPNSFDCSVTDVGVNTPFFTITVQLDPTTDAQRVT